MKHEGGEDHHVDASYKQPSNLSAGLDILLNETWGRGEIITWTHHTNNPPTYLRVWISYSMKRGDGGRSSRGRITQTTLQPILLFGSGYLTQ